MAEPATRSQPVRFGVFELDLRTGELRRSGVRVKMQDQPFRILALLLNRPGTLVTREELRSALWPSDTFIDFENGLNTAVARLRQALGDSAETPRYIETIPRRGYRFIGSIETGVEHDPAALAPVPHTSPRPRTVAFAAVVAAFLAAVQYFALRPAARQSFSYTVERLTMSGDIAEAILTPDGKSLVYTAGPSGRLALRVRSLASGEDREVAGVPHGPLYGIALSSDSKRIYLRFDDATHEIPITGGAPVKMLGGRAGVAFANPAPNGSDLLFVEGDRAKGGLTVSLARKDGADERQLLRYEFPRLVYSPTWAPAGNRFSFGGTPSGFFIWDLMVQEVKPGASPRIVSRRHFYRIGRQAWLDGGRAIAFAAVDTAGTDTVYQVWALTYPSGRLTPITNGLDSYPSVSASSDSRLLGAVREQTASEILVASARGAVVQHATSSGPARQGHDGLTFVGDDRLVFSSQASGTNELWSVRSNGAELRRLTSNRDRNFTTSAPVDGSAVFWSVMGRLGALPTVWSMDADGTNARPLSRSGLPTVSPDGKFLACVVTPERGNPILVRYELTERSGPRTVSTLAAAPLQPSISPDGRWIAFGSEEPGRAGTAVVPAAGGDPIGILPVPAWSVQWAADGKSLIYIRSEGGVDNLWTAPVFGGEAKQITRFEEGSIFRFARSATGKYLAVVHGTRSRDAVLLRASNER